MEGILGYIRFVLKRIILLIVRISTFFILHNSKNFPLACLFHPARLLDSGEYTTCCGLVDARIRASDKDLSVCKG